MTKHNFTNKTALKVIYTWVFYIWVYFRRILRSKHKKPIRIFILSWRKYLINPLNTICVNKGFSIIILIIFRFDILLELYLLSDHLIYRRPKNFQYTYFVVIKFSIPNQFIRFLSCSKSDVILYNTSLLWVTVKLSWYFGILVIYLYSFNVYKILNNILIDIIDFLIVIC